ncbi:MAG: IS91 family transposase, partial [Alteromonadales bacterium]|nr:IS91 family transposase [Alteromonadales bacterium]
MSKVTVQSFLQQSFSTYRQHHALPLYQIKAAEQLMKCRTASLGGHSIYCEDG